MVRRTGPITAVRRALPVPVTLMVMIALAGVVAGRVYAGDLLPLLVLGSAVGAVGLSAALRRAQSVLIAPVSVAGLAGYTAFVLWFTARRAQLPGGFAEIAADAVRNGIPRLLTALIPVDPVPDTVVVPVVAAWLAGLAAAEVALRAGRVLLGFVPPTLLYAGAVYVVGPNADPAIWPSVAFAAVAATGLAASGPRVALPPPDPAATDAPTDASTAARADAAVLLGPAARTALRLRLALGTAAGLAVVIALAAGVAPLVAGRVETTPVDPRRYVQPPVVDSLDENPLIRISGWALNPDQHLLDVRTEARSSAGDAPVDPAPDDGAQGGPAPDDASTADPAPDDATTDDPGRDGSEPVLIRLAVLNDYDGVTWRVGATYRNAGRVLPAARPLPGATVETVRQEITVADLTGRLLPAVPTPREISGARVAYDPVSGTLIRPEGLTPQLRYTVDSAQERPDLNLLPTANVPAGEAVARVLRVEPGTPEQMQRLADQLAAENGAPYSRALAAEDFLAEHYRMVADAPSGHAYPNLNFFLFGPRNGGGQRGTSEQFAAAFAVLGRLMGLPTRVVVGFRSPTGTGPVRGADAFAWPEVLFDELGWVRFDPLPRPDTEPRPVEEDFKPRPEDPPPSPEQPAPTVEPSASAPPAEAAPPRGADRSPTVLAGLASGGGLLLITAVLLTLLWLRRAQRRRRLHTGGPVQRIAGAWRELTDALRLAGQPAAGHLAATEVAAHARAVVTAPRPGRRNGPGVDKVTGSPVDGTTALAVDELAALVNVAAFAPGTASEEQARQAGRLAVEYADRLRARRSWWRRLLWSLHPGPLRWRP